MHGALFVGLETAAGAGGARHTQAWLCAQEFWQLGWHLWPKEVWFSLHVAAEAELWFWGPSGAMWGSLQGAEPAGAAPGFGRSIPAPFGRQSFCGAT